MTELKTGDAAPDFSLPDDEGNTRSLSDFKGQKLVLYFYPKDDTPGCTQESCDFRDNMAAFNSSNIQVFGISKDSVAKHQKFKAKYGFNFPLLSDENGDMCESYGVWVEKSMYGRKYMGIDRSTFLIDENGRIAEIWRKVKVPGHVDAVKEASQALTKAA